MRRRRAPRPAAIAPNESLWSAVQRPMKGRRPLVSSNASVEGVRIETNAAPPGGVAERHT